MSRIVQFPGAWYLETGARIVQVPERWQLETQPVAAGNRFRSLRAGGNMNAGRGIGLLTGGGM